MPVSSHHPEYARRAEDFRKARDTIEGEREVKGLNLTLYLPVPPGLDEASGQVVITHTTGQRDIRASRYAFYASFAEFPELPGPTIEAFQGLVHGKKPDVNLPADMQYLINSATPAGETLQSLWEMQTRELFSVGRFVFLGEIDEATDEPLLCPYICESLINWQESTRREGTDTSMAVLHDVEFEFKDGDEFEQQLVSRFRELRLRNGEGQPEGGTYQVRRWKSAGANAFTAQSNATDATIVRDENTDEEGWTEVQRIGANLEFIPIIVSNSHEVGMQYGRIPILPISNIALSIFRRSADYGRALYVKGDPQTVIYGIDESDAPETVGGSEIWIFNNENAKAEYLDIDGDGIPLMRQFIVDKFEQYVSSAGRLLEHSQRNGQESGVAVEKRMNGQHVTVASVTTKAGEAMQTALRMIGRMLDKDEAALEEITFVPNIDFVEATMTGQELLQLVSSKNMGAPISRESIHGLMRKGQLTTKTFEDEEASIDSEPPPITGLTGLEEEDDKTGPDET